MANLEKAQDQVLKNDQLNKIDAKDVKFNMDNYEMTDKVPENEKKEYEKLNERFKDIREKLAKQNDKFNDGGVQKKVRNFLEADKSSQVGASFDSLGSWDDKIWFFSYNEKMKWYDTYDLIPYRKGERPYLMFETWENKTPLTVKQYESMLTKIETLYNKQESAYNQIKNQENSKVDDMITNL